MARFMVDGGGSVRRDGVTRRAALAAVAAALAASSGCSAPGAGAGEGSAEAALQVLAANSLEKAMPEVQDLFSSAAGAAFADTQYKGSGDLVEQLRGGAPADILITASEDTMDDAAEAGLVDTSTRVDMFSNDLVVVRAAGSGVQLGSLGDVASVDGRIAIGEPGAVPAGRYANQALASVGLYSSATGVDGEYDASIADRVVQADKVGTAAQYVATGDCAIGFVYSSDVYRYEGIEVALTCPAESHDAIVYPGAVAAPSADPARAADFLDFCMSDEDALAVWAEYGFELA